MKKIMTMALLAVLTMGVVNAQSADAIAKNYVNAIGGAAKWKALKSMKMTISLNQQGMDIPGSMLADESNRQRMEFELNGMKMIQATDGETAWALNPFMGQTSATKLPEDQAQAMNSDEFLDDFIDYKKRGSTISLEGEADMGGKACYKVKLTKSDGNEMTYFFDKETSLMVAEVTNAAGQELTMHFSDYQEVGGFMMPMKLTQKAGGVTTLAITIKKVEFNVEVSDDLFAFPGN